jgi:Na+-driven multidrug efflux pump
VHIWAGVFVFLGSASGQYLIAEGYTKMSMLRTGVGAIVNIVLNIFWLPKYGILGAAYATLAAYGIATFFIVFIPKTREQGLLMLRSLFLISLFQKIIKR